MERCIKKPSRTENDLGRMSHLRKNDPRQRQVYFPHTNALRFFPPTHKRSCLTYLWAYTCSNRSDVSSIILFLCISTVPPLNYGGVISQTDLLVPAARVCGAQKRVTPLSARWDFNAQTTEETIALGVDI